MLPTETNSERRRNSSDVIAPAGVLRLAAGRVRPNIARGNAMIGSGNARVVANLAIASALTIFLGACSSSLPSFMTPGTSEPPVADGPGPDMPGTIRSDEIVGRWAL